MRINGINRVGARQPASAPEGMAAGPAALRETAVGAAVAPGVSEPPQAASTSSPGIASVQMLVAVSALGPTDERRRLHMAQARKGLDMLDRLHREMLSGVAGRATLNALMEWIADRPESDDPKLAAVIADINLRAQVELAKFDL